MTASFHGAPCWYELATSDIAAAQTFYAAILGWTIADSGTPGMDYRLAKAGDAMVAGLMPAMDGQPAAWSIYFAVDDCDATTEAAKTMGATVIVPPPISPIPGAFRC